MDWICLKSPANGSPTVSFPEGGLIEFHGTRGGGLFPLPYTVSSSNDEKGRQ
jgi:hypothetical protein